MVLLIDISCVLLQMLAKLKLASFVEKAGLFKSSWLVAMATQVLEAE